MKYRPLGNSGITVSEVGMGTNTISGTGTHGHVDEADGAAAVQRAYEAGITFFDTAEGYSEGRSETVLGKVLGDKRDVVICTKVGSSGGPLTAERIRSAAEGSLRRLQRDVLDVYLLHNPRTAAVTDPSIKEEMEALLRDGLIRSYGVSVLVADLKEQAEVVMRAGGYTSMELAMNVAEQEAEDTLLPQARNFGIGAIIRTPLGGGVLTGKYDAGHQFPDNDTRSAVGARPGQPADRTERRFGPVEPLRKLAQEEGISVVRLALAWVLSHPEVSTIIPGAKNPAQAEDNAAASDVTLSADALDRLRAMRVT